MTEKKIARNSNGKNTQKLVRAHLHIESKMPSSKLHRIFSWSRTNFSMKCRWSFDDSHFILIFIFLIAKGVNVWMGPKTASKNEAKFALETAGETFFLFPPRLSFQEKNLQKNVIFHFDHLCERRNELGTLEKKMAYPTIERFGSTDQKEVSLPKKCSWWVWKKVSFERENSYVQSVGVRQCKMRRGQ